MLYTLLVILVLFALLGGWGHTRGWGYYGWSPLGLIILIIVIMALTGTLR